LDESPLRTASHRRSSFAAGVCGKPVVPPNEQVGHQVEREGDAHVGTAPHAINDDHGTVRGRRDRPAGTGSRVKVT